MKIIIPDKEAAPMIRMMFEKYASGGVAIKDVANLLYENGFRTKRGKRVSTSTIHKMLKNPIYKGDFIWNGIRYEGKHKPIVSSTLWYEVQDMLGERSIEKPKQGHQFSYIGLMKCGYCGCAITAERRKGRYSYYHCTGYKGKHGEPHTREEVLDEQFSEMLKSIFIDREIADWILGSLERSAKDKWHSLKETRERQLREREKLLRRSELLYDDRLSGRITTERFDQRNTGIRRELEVLEEKIENLSTSTYKDPLDYARGVIELGHRADNFILTAPAEEKREFLQEVLSNCTLRENRIYPELAEPYASIADANAKWRSSGGVSGGSDFIHSVWHPEGNSNT